MSEEGSIIGCVGRTGAALVGVAVVVLTATVVAGAWELQRLDTRINGLRADVQQLSSKPQLSAVLNRALRSLAALRAQATNLRESGLRQEFQQGVDAQLTRLIVAVEAGNLACTAGKRRWQNYINSEVIPDVNKPANRDLSAALQHDDPDYHATLLNAYNVAC